MNSPLADVKVPLPCPWTMRPLKKLAVSFPPECIVLKNSNTSSSYLCLGLIKMLNVSFRNLYSILFSGSLPFLIKESSFTDNGCAFSRITGRSFNWQSVYWSLSDAEDSEPSSQLRYLWPLWFTVFFHEEETKRTCWPSIVYVSFLTVLANFNF